MVLFPFWAAPWHMVLGPGTVSEPQLQPMRLLQQELFPGPGTPQATGWPKKKKKKRSQINNTIINKLVSLFSDLKLHAKYCYTTSSLLYRIPRFHLLASPLKLNKDLLTLIFDLQSPYKGFWQVLLLFLFSDGRR